ncbi:Ykof family thiamine-binding protein [Pelagibacterium xiamenense]|uniref:Ykof family thiamine-binding protein n=1 Tax=Pelagibacterium xiamenense TaxID=2901140 RepID=UPI001E51325C|nr:Ykof family thiamine-binding protein [Pelagibacterium xiamenense]MCD7060184.1 Ykof family thiamine-binding protein [Pelagibacterium xiamenense]
MYSGVQFSLYPMSGDFVGVITNALGALDPHRERLKIETDDVSTLLVGPPETLFPAMRDIFVAAASSGVHCVLSATVSRGCPGGEDQSICDTEETVGAVADLKDRIASATKKVADAPRTGQPVNGQFALYVLGSDTHMPEVYGCIELLENAGILEKPKHFVTKVEGDAGAVFEGLSEVFLRFGPSEGHVTLDVTISANSPSKTA